MRRAFATLAASAILTAPAAAQTTPGPVPGTHILDRDTYAEKLRGMWLAECVANWTGRRTEGRWTAPPFGTDADWNTGTGSGRIEFVFLDPWDADDDTDIEYAYVFMLESAAGPTLTPDEIAAGWIAHINRFIWVSNERARARMDEGLTPPETGMPHANQFWLYIDAQLTTEFFGALAPGMPAAALETSMLPIQTTASGHALHAAQWHVLLRALAPVVPQNLSPEDQVLWLATESRDYLPPDSKAVEVINFVIDDYLANPDVNDWERTRDLVYDRYQLNALANGWRYRGWTESSVNLASSVLCLLYGQGDLRRTIQIGTLSGWDSDNPTCSIAATLGLMLGEQAVRDAFPETTLSSRYDAARTRDNLPDYLPDDPQADDTLDMLVERMLPIVDRTVKFGGGRVSPNIDKYLLPPLPQAGARLNANPVSLELNRSANQLVRDMGGSVTTSSTATGASPRSPGVASTGLFANTTEFDLAGDSDPTLSSRRVYSSDGSPVTAPTLTVNYSLPITVDEIRFAEGFHFQTEGGWFDTITIELRIANTWTTPSAIMQIDPLDPSIPWQVIRFKLDIPTEITGIRISGTTSGSTPFVTCAEIDAFTPAPAPPPLGYNLDRSRAFDSEDLYEFRANPVDVNADGAADNADAKILETIARWMEIEDMKARRR